MELKTIFEGNLQALAKDRDAGVGTAVTRTRVRPGGSVTCDIEDSHWRLIGDEMPGDGGSGLGPDPGVFGRASLGSCLAMGYAMWGAYMDIALEAVEVVVEADYDAHGMLGLDDSISPGWSAVRYRVEIASSAPEERVREMVERADRYSSILDCLRRPLEVRRELVINGRG